MGPQSLAGPLVGIALVVSVGCGAPSEVSVSNARAHLTMLAEEIGRRPLGTDANASARAYLIAELERSGFSVRVQQARVTDPVTGLSAQVFNIIAVAPGETTDALGLMAHYDSVPDGPGAADDAFGAAVAVEAARVLAARRNRRHTLLVLLTDGEEVGLLGARALLAAPEVADRLRAYLNLEAIGPGGPAFLFESGPGHGGPLQAWARHAPYPRGASFALEIYRRLPRDTDFSIFREAGIPGLNFALVGESYGYHTDRDTADRIADRVLRRTVENAVATLAALDQTDWTVPPPPDTRYFDLLGRVGVSYGDAAGRIVAVVAILAAIAAWWRIIMQAMMMVGIRRMLVAMLWIVVGSAAVVGSMIAAVWLLRALREVYHPWYGPPPGRLLAWLLGASSLAACGVSRLASGVGAPGVPHPAAIWCFTLPVWMALAGLTEWLVPAAAFLWTVPLLAAGLALLTLARGDAASYRVASAAILLVVGVLWLRDGWLLLEFLVTVLGRQPIVTPVWLLPAFVTVVALMVVPPLAGLRDYEHPWLSRPTATATAVLLCAGALVSAYIAPAYTADRPLRATARYLQHAGTDEAVWELGSNEPMLAMAIDGRALEWRPAVDAATPAGQWIGALSHPFVLRAIDPRHHAVPAAISASLARRGSDGRFQLIVVPEHEGTTVAIVFPPDVVPRDATLPGIVGADGRWRAGQLAVSGTGMAFEATLTDAAADLLRQSLVIIETQRLPDAPANGQPAWLRAEHIAWRTTASYVQPLAGLIAEGNPAGSAR